MSVITKIFFAVIIVFALFALSQNVLAEGEYCGDTMCNAGETCSSCPSDCGQCGPVCGNALCESGEASSCPQDCPYCPQGSIYTPCNCGGSLYNSGYCCDNVWRATDCVTQTPCAEGGIPSSGCMCNNAMYYSGWCCSGAYRSTDCGQQQTYCPYNSPITYSCMCGGATYSSGYCCNNVWQSSQCTTQNTCPYNSPITYSCTCGSGTYSTGYCCNGIWQSTACTTQMYCPQGPINYSCMCGNTTYSSGYCCNNAWQSSTCSGQYTCGYGYIPPAGCTCNNVMYYTGYCCNGIWQSNACTTQNTCPQGYIPSSGCMCNNAMYYSGYCCNNLYQTTACTTQNYCPSGPITSSCMCGNTTYSSGYCCNGIWQSTACTTQMYCPQGPINYSCMCGNTTYSSGYCCNNAWQSGPCVYESYCPYGSITYNCKCGTANYSSGYCCNGVYQSMPCGGQQQTCPEGQIVSSCMCSGMSYGWGWCCNGVYRSYDCGQKQSCSSLGGTICPDNMMCPGTILPAYDSGKCCNGQCVTYQKTCPYGSIPPEGCICGGILNYSGYCCNGVHENNACGEVKCGNGNCEGWYGESYQNCPSDCKPSMCGDNKCDYMYGENEYSCPPDCGSKCPNGICEGAETYITCHDDCKQPVQAKCGDSVCDMGMGENSSNCPQDCTAMNKCGNYMCEYPETNNTCPSDCKPVTYCGDGKCDYGFGENEFNCDKDCPKQYTSVCGNKMCEYGEDPTKCSVDCMQGKCGDNYCNFGEDPNTCPNDCGMIIKQPIKMPCPPQEVINQILEKCKMYGMQSYMKMTPDGCNIAECMPSSGPMPTTPSQCVKETDPVTGMEIMRCQTQQMQCGSEPPEIKQHCIEQKGTPRLSVDPRGCQITICEYGAFGQETQPGLFSQESCLSPGKIDKFARECKGKVLIDVASNGCRYPKCEGELVGITETICPAFNLDEIRKLESDCTVKGGQMYKMFDEKLCPKPKCVEPGQETTQCEDVPEEAYTRCAKDGGQLVVKKDDKGCIVFVDCIKQQTEQYEYDRIEELPETSELLAMVFKLEALNMEFDKLQKRAQSIAEYYNSTGDTATAERFTKVASMFGSAKERIEEIKNKMKVIAEREEEPTKGDIIGLKLEIKEIKKLLKDILFVMLGSSKKEKIEEGRTVETVEDCGGDSPCFMKNFRVCSKAKIVSTEGGGGNQIIGEIFGLKEGICSYQIGLKSEVKKLIMNCKEKDYVFAEFTPQRFRDTCTGDVEEFLGIMESKAPQPQVGQTEEPIKCEPPCALTTTDGQPTCNCPTDENIQAAIKKKNPWVGMIVGVRQWRK